MVQLIPLGFVFTLLVLVGLVKPWALIPLLFSLSDLSGLLVNVSQFGGVNGDILGSTQVIFEKLQSAVYLAILMTDTFVDTAETPMIKTQWTLVRHGPVINPGNLIYGAADRGD